MPKLRVNAEEAAREAFRREVKIRRVCCDMTQQALGNELGLSSSWMSEMLSDPDKISVGRMRKIVRALKPDPAVILSLLGYPAKDVQVITK
jgi:hypothetical protein